MEVKVVAMNTLLWEVDAQADFLLPGGKLYVPQAEKIIPNLNRLVETARHGRSFLISSADAHQPDDPEFREWPPHCVKGTPGAELVPEARAANYLVIPNQHEFALPRDLGAYQQVILEKNTLDVFDNPNTDALLARLNTADSSLDPGPDFVVFGVVTEYCVHRTADVLLRRGRRVNLVKDAIQSLDQKKGSGILNEFQSRGARLITTEEALALVLRDTLGAAEVAQKKTAGTDADTKEILAAREH
jgi:nicotinamidase/pyrazinamidase